MTIEEAIRFLAAHQPFVATDQLDEATLARMDAAREVLTESPDPRCVRLWLHAFGEGDAHGFYPLVVDCLRPHGSQLVVPELVESLGSPVRSVRYWSTQMAMEFLDDALIEPLVQIIADVRADLELRQAALATLDLIGSEKSDEAVERVVAADGELKAFLDDLRS